MSVIVVPNDRPMTVALLDHLGERTVTSMEFELSRRWRVERPTHDRVDHAAVTCDDDG
ncbi:MAG: hypothetical protein RLZZ270_1213, partial [Actinomycetota bacterium]